MNWDEAYHHIESTFPPASYRPAMWKLPLFDRMSSLQSSSPSSVPQHAGPCLSDCWRHNTCLDRQPKAKSAVSLCPSPPLPPHSPEGIMRGLRWASRALAGSGALAGLGRLQDRPGSSRDAPAEATRFSRFARPSPWTSPALRCEAPKRKLTVAELLALKGKRQIVMTTAFDEWTARAAEKAGVDIIVAWGSCQEHSKFVVQAVRRGAPNTLIGTGINPGAYDAGQGDAYTAWRLKT